MQIRQANGEHWSQYQTLKKFLGLIVIRLHMKAVSFRNGVVIKCSHDGKGQS
jgi:hypothetical protein